jgi:2'-5' RNA ligase
MSALDPSQRPRLFFAFWPDTAARASLESARAALFPLDGRPVAPADLHVTAAFLGSVDASRLAALQRLAATVPPFELRFDRVGYWAKPRVLVALARESPVRAVQAIDALWSQLARLGFRRDPRPWRPHVTLAREARPPRRDPPWQAVTWPVDRLVLVESLPTGQSGTGGARYRPLA